MNYQKKREKLISMNMLNFYFTKFNRQSWWRDQFHSMKSTWLFDYFLRCNRTSRMELRKFEWVWDWPSWILLYAIVFISKDQVLNHRRGLISNIQMIWNWAHEPLFQQELNSSRLSKDLLIQCQDGSYLTSSLLILGRIF